MNEVLLANIIDKEWGMFVSVINEGGQSSCQKDRSTFNIMRSSQFYTFPVEVLDSYLNDLDNSILDGRNLMTEKYARMMESASPDQFAKIKNCLPEINPISKIYIENILSIFLEWHDLFHNRYPFLSSLGRTALSDGDTIKNTSIETYLRGELETYSPETLKLYHDFVIDMYRQSVNLVEKTLYFTVVQYGYKTLDEANEAIKASTEVEIEK